MSCVCGRSPGGREVGQGNAMLMVVAVRPVLGFDDALRDRVRALRRKGHHRPWIGGKY